MWREGGDNEMVVKVCTLVTQQTGSTSPSESAVECLGALATGRMMERTVGRCIAMG